MGHEGKDFLYTNVEKYVKILYMYQRISNPLLSNSFFLFGARGTGKSSLLQKMLPPSGQVLWLNLLDNVLYQELVARPQVFFERIPKNFNSKSWIVIDEVQRIPDLLNSVHQVIEERKIKFALTGSSARKLKRGSANLLAGRAFVNNLHPLTNLELKNDFNLLEVLQWGSLPAIWSQFPSPLSKREYLRSYVANYIREEIKEEQIVRQIDPFVRFLEVAAQHNSKIINASKIGRDSLSDSASVLRYFDILVDTLLGFYLEPYHRSVRKIQTAKSKFYFFDLGVKRAAEGTLDSSISPGTYGFGEAFEHFFILECKRLSEYLRKEDRFFYVRTGSDVEIDLIIERSKKETWAIEIKSSERVDEKDLLRSAELSKDLKFKKLFVASRETQKREVGNIEIWPWKELLEEIYK